MGEVPAQTPEFRNLCFRLRSLGPFDLRISSLEEWATNISLGNVNDLQHSTFSSLAYSFYLRWKKGALRRTGEWVLWIIAQQKETSTSSTTHTPPNLDGTAFIYHLSCRTKINTEQITIITCRFYLCSPISVTEPLNGWGSFEWRLHSIHRVCCNSRFSISKGVPLRMSFSSHWFLFSSPFAFPSAQHASFHPHLHRPGGFYFFFFVFCFPYLFKLCYYHVEININFSFSVH